MATRKQCLPGSYTYEHTAVVTVQVQTRPNSTPVKEEGGGGCKHEFPPQCRSYWQLIIAGRGRDSFL